MTYKRRVHIQDPRFSSLSLCKQPWDASRGGVPKSDTDPPVVRDEESGSVSAVTCERCLLLWRRSRGPKPTAT